jgi:hypothetical protein
LLFFYIMTSHAPTRTDLAPPVPPDGRGRRGRPDRRPPARPGRPRVHPPQRHLDQGRHRRRGHGPGPSFLPGGRPPRRLRRRPQPSRDRPRDERVPGSPATPTSARSSSAGTSTSSTSPPSPLARPDGRRRRRGRQGRLVREAHDPDDRRGPGRRPGRRADGPDLPGQHLVPVPGPLLRHSGPTSGRSRRPSRAVSSAGR